MFRSVSEENVVWTWAQRATRFHIYLDSRRRPFASAPVNEFR